MCVDDSVTGRREVLATPRAYAAALSAVKNGRDWQGSREAARQRIDEQRSRQSSSNAGFRTFKEIVHPKKPSVQTPKRCSSEVALR